MNDWYLYLIRTRQHTLYTGITTDIPRRFDEHMADAGRGSKYLKSRRPLQLVYQSKIGSRALALRAECAVKKLTKQKKETLIRENPEASVLLKMLGFPVSGEASELCE